MFYAEVRRPGGSWRRHGSVPSPTPRCLSRTLSKVPGQRLSHESASASLHHDMWTEVPSDIHMLCQLAAISGSCDSLVTRAFRRLYGSRVIRWGKVQSRFQVARGSPLAGVFGGRPTPRCGPSTANRRNRGRPVPTNPGSEEPGPAGGQAVRASCTVPTKAAGRLLAALGGLAGALAVVASSATTASARVD